MTRVAAGRMLSAAVLLGGAMPLGMAGCAGGGRKTSQTPPPVACAPANPAPCEAACFAGDGKACAIYGMAAAGIADAPVRLKKDIAGSRRALEHGCKADDLDACSELQGLNYDYAGKHAACEAYMTLCDRGHLRSCSFAGNCLIYEHGFPHDIERAIALYQASCDRSERVGCRELSALVERGVYVEADPARAFALIKKACALDDPLSCAHEGRFLERGIGTKADVEAARKLYRASCARGIRQLPCEALERLGETPPAIVER